MVCSLCSMVRRGTWSVVCRLCSMVRRGNADRDPLGDTVHGLCSMVHHGPWSVLTVQDGAEGGKASRREQLAAARVGDAERGREGRLWQVRGGIPGGQTDTGTLRVKDVLTLRMTYLGHPAR